MTTETLAVRVRKRLGAFDLRCNLELPLAGLTALFGSSGAGKSTLINLVAGLHRPDEGRIAVGGRLFCDRAAGIDLPVEKRELGVVFQDARLFPHLTVRQNLLFGFRRAGTRARSPRATVESVVDLLGLAALLDRRPHTLSGGERQRTAIGRALLAQPRLLLLDEPLASLDAPRKAEVLPYIERLRDACDVPILYVSHAVDEVLRLASTLVVLDRGAVVAAGPIDDVIWLPEVARLFPAAEAGTLLHCRVREHDSRYGLSQLETAGRVGLRVPRLDIPVGTPVRVRIPARDVALSLSQPVDVSIVNRLPGVVAAVEPLDETHVDVQVRVGGDGTRLRARITREATERLVLAPGLPLWCLIKSVALDRVTLLVASERTINWSSARSPAANDEAGA
jgi:molybdate transport system ATP-binding protein